MPTKTYHVPNVDELVTICDQLYKVLNESQKRVLGVGVSAHFALPDLVAISCEASVAHIFLMKFPKIFSDELILTRLINFLYWK